MSSLSSDVFAGELKPSYLTGISVTALSGNVKRFVMLLIELFHFIQIIRQPAALK